MHETNRIKFKKKLNDGFEKSVVSFLNYPGGGEILIGIDKDGTVLGVGSAKKTTLKVIERIRKNIRPQADGLFDAVPVEIDNKKIIRVIVSCGPQRPYYLKKMGMSEEGCFIRAGTSAEPMTGEDIEDALSKRQQFTLQSMISPDQDLRFEHLRKYYKEKGFEPTKQLADDLDLRNKDSYNYAAYLLADDNGVSIRVAMYAGTDRSNPSETLEYGNCCLITAAEHVLEKLDSEKDALRKTTEGRSDKRRLNDSAMREAVVNAFVHNDYSMGVPLMEIFSDRIVVTSSGGLAADLSAEDLFKCRSMPRNRELMRVFRDVGLAGQIGSGIGQILRAYERTVFELKPDSVSITFPFAGDFIMPKNKVKAKTTAKASDMINEAAEKTDDKDEPILNLLRSNPDTTIPEISKLTGMSPRTISRRLREYQDTGAIHREGARKNGRWIVKK